MEAQGHDPSGYDFLRLTWQPAAAGEEVRGEWTLTRMAPSQPPVVLARMAGSHEAFALGVPREVTIDFEHRRIRVHVAGEEVIDVAGSFRPGRVPSGANLRMALPGSRLRAKTSSFP